MKKYSILFILLILPMFSNAETVTGQCKHLEITAELPQSINPGQRFNIPVNIKTPYYNKNIGTSGYPMLVKAVLKQRTIPGVLYLGASEAEIETKMGSLNKGIRLNIPVKASGKLASKFKLKKNKFYVKATIKPQTPIPGFGKQKCKTNMAYINLNK